MADPAGVADHRARRAALAALIAGHVALHATMNGVRLAAPLLALRDGATPLLIGLLIGVFAAVPVLTAMFTGRMADRHGYHGPVRAAAACGIAGALCALAASLWPGGRLPLLFAAAGLCGAGANSGFIIIMRTAGQGAHDPVEQRRVFSWLALAPALANMIGPVLAGLLIDAIGYPGTFVAMAMLPLVTLAMARQVPREAPSPVAADRTRKHSFDLFTHPGFARLLFVNWLLSASWDVHSFLLPILGHERGFSASAIGFVLGVFAAAVTAVRLAIPVLAHRLDESRVLVGAMLVCGVTLAAYPFARAVPVMALLAVSLGLALGAVQPMVMTTLHQITPAHRHGEAIALRSMTINLSSSLMPLGFGFVGAAFGSAALFWMMGAMVGAGSMAARRVGPADDA